MPRVFLERRSAQFLRWWHAPATSRDRLLGALVGALGCFWIGVLGRVIVGPLPVSLQELGWWAIGSVAAGVALGLLFPKAMACICFPFAMSGGGS
jgi:hypothetical protein